MKENSDPNSNLGSDGKISKQPKLIPVNLIKSLASLSMTSCSENQDKEEEEVLNKSTHNDPNPAALETAARKSELIGQVSNTQQGFNFTATKSNSQALVPKLTMKQKARRSFKPVAGVKRNQVADSVGQIHKKQCSDNVSAAEEGKGATPQLAPNSQ
ncbi:hypothetical protein PIB30_001087 [Stylosanthes scabra]|uniref:Uncharacterized protein n=1 Tax=Stylosanthes scabra TaxID=79078 RepID=A0ABU6U459_9FABA|nr:hypothetical protein [Stylosanthes scabra]